MQQEKIHFEQRLALIVQCFAYFRPLSGSDGRRIKGQINIRARQVGSPTTRTEKNDAFDFGVGRDQLAKLGEVTARHIDWGESSHVIIIPNARSSCHHLDYSWLPFVRSFT